MIESGEARNEAGLSHQVGFFRVTFKNFITLLKRVPEVIQTMEELGRSKGRNVILPKDACVQSLNCRERSK
jgi:hypothetical protein